MDPKRIDNPIDTPAIYFTGPDMPLNEREGKIRRGGKFQLRERADGFFRLREQLGIRGFKSVEQAQRAIRLRVGLLETD